MASTGWREYSDIITNVKRVKFAFEEEVEQLLAEGWKIYGYASATDDDGKVRGRVMLIRAD